MKEVGGGVVSLLLYRIALIHLCALDTPKHFDGSRTSFESFGLHRLFGAAYQGGRLVTR